MERCNKVNEWLEQDPPPDMEKIPGFLAEHMKGCPECNQTVGFIRGLTRDRDLPSLSPSETAEFVDQFRMKARESDPALCPDRLSDWARAFWPRFHWVLAGAICFFLLAIGFSRIFRPASPPVSGESPPFAVLRGKAVLLSSSGSLESVGSGSEQGIFKETGMSFDSPADPVELRYRSGGEVLLSGQGRMKVADRELTVEAGKFLARFRNLGGVMKIRVPFAVIGIRGTEIRFDIHLPEARLLLVEGAADLIPDKGAGKSCSLEKGREISLSDGEWKTLPPEFHPVPTPEPTPNPASDDRQISLATGSALPDDRRQAPVELPSASEAGVATGTMTDVGENPDLVGGEGFQHD